VCFRPADVELYWSLLRARAPAVGVSIRAYCLMPNHVHLLVVPERSDSLDRLFRVVHAHYAELVNARLGWTGHLWQQRFASCPMDTVHLAVALEYVHDNPVRAGLVARPTDWPWSSARAELLGESDDLIDQPPSAAPARLPCPPGDSAREEFELLRSRSRTGRPWGDDSFVRDLEQRLGRTLSPRRRGPKPRDPSLSGPTETPSGEPLSEPSFGVW
jgi:putative transposase